MPDFHSKVLESSHVTNDLKNEIKISQNLASDKNERK